jgi:hypothetical protein
VEVLPSEDELHVGDPVRIELSIDLPAHVQPTFPEWQETWGEAEIREVSEIRSVVNADGTKTVSQELTLAIYRTGDVVLPPPSITLSADPANEEDVQKPEVIQPIMLTVTSLLPTGDEIPEPRPPAPPVPLAWGKPFFWTAGLLGIMSLAALVLALRRQRSYAAASSSAVDPLTALAAALDGLRSETSVEQMFAGMSLHLRRFFGYSLAFPAAESTTSEIRLRLREKRLPVELITRTETLLRQCDSVKFARHEMAREDAEHGLGEAAAIGTSTMETLTPAPAEETEGAL